MRKLFVLILTALVFAGLKAQELAKNWEVAGLEAPESVIKHDTFYYVSNVAGQPAEKNGQGYISRLNKKGEIVEQKWATGFNAPKGLGVYDNTLYVADIDVVAVVDLATGEIIKKFDAERATFLNDIEVALNGDIFITDTFGGNAIYKIKDDTISLWLKDEMLNYPNGLKVQGSELFVSTWGVVTNPETFETEVPGMVLAVNLEDKKIRTVTKSFGNLDGLVPFQDGFIVSDWISGKIISVTKKGNTKELMQLPKGTADIFLEQNDNNLLIPIMLEGKLISYSLK